MKKLMYFLCLLCGVVGNMSNVNAQILSFSDPNFKAAVLANGIDIDGDGEIDISEAGNALSLDVSNFNISSMSSITFFGSLQYLNCSNNPFTYLDVSNNPDLGVLVCSNTQITSLDVSNNTMLGTLYCDSTQITSLDVSNNTMLGTLYCDSTQITSLDVSNNLYLDYLSCSNTQLTSLDVSNNEMLSNLICHSNNNLSQLFLKNGSLYSAPNLDFSNNFNLSYICSDANEVTYIQSKLQQYGMTNVFVSTLCSYQPNGSYNTLSGQTLIDMDMNGCTPNDSASPFIFIGIYNGTSTNYTYCSNQQGNYLAYLNTGNYTLKSQIANLTYFTANIATVSFANNNNNTQTQDLCIVPNGIFPDVEITFIPVNNARPGFDSYYQIHYKNVGTTVANGDITLNFQGNKMNFLNASVSPTNQTSSQLTWNYSNLQPFESRIITLTMNVLPPPTNNIGELLNFDANISLTNDNDVTNNVSPLYQTIVGAYDPNDKTCLEGNLVHNDKIGEYLHYLVRFQNTGNYPAENVVIVDSLDAAKYDLASLQIIETSHDAHIDLKSNVLQFYFENIQLADSFSNEPASHGFVVYKIKTKNTLPQNSSVSNKAEIYFDYNLPVITNLETTTFTDFVGIAAATQNPHFQCYPNPAQNNLTIETEKNEQFTIVNVMGEVVKTMEIKGKETIDISRLPKGIYFLKARNQVRGISFVKE